MKITKVVCPSDKIKIKCPYTMEPEYVTVHNTANDASAMSEVSYMLGNSNEVSFHYAVDDTRAVQGIDENRNAWHAGDGSKGKGNRKSIGIEICYSKSGGSNFTKSEKNAAILVADILKRYGWGIDKVKRHKDWSGKNCPHRTIKLGWDRFLKMVEAELEEKKEKSTKKEKVNIYYKVKVQKQGWLGEIKNYNNINSKGYAGNGSPVIGLAVKVDKGSVKYRVHVKGGKWLGWVTGYNTKDSKNGYAGNGKPIDAVQIYYYTPDSIRPYKKAKYKVNNYSWQHDTDKTNGQDGYAGVMGVVVTKIKATIE